MQEPKKLKDDHGATVNKAQKPVVLFAKHLKAACSDGDVVIDVTAGTGTTAVRLPSPHGLCLGPRLEIQLSQLPVVPQVAAAFLSYWGSVHLVPYEVPHDLKVILIDSDAHQLQWAKKRLDLWYRESPGGEVQRYRFRDFEFVPDLLPPESYEEALGKSKKGKTPVQVEQTTDGAGPSGVRETP